MRPAVTAVLCGLVACLVLTSTAAPVLEPRKDAGAARAHLAAAAAVPTARNVTPAEQEAYDREHAALLAIKASMPDLDNTTWAYLGWNASSNHCTSWGGIACTPEGDPVGRVAILDLWGQGLYGSVPWEAIGQLSKLRALWIDENPGFKITPPNRLDPDLPTKLPELFSFWLTEAGIAGSIPSSYGTWKGLGQLCLQRNSLVGPLPATLPANITTVTLYDNSNLTAPVGGFGGWANKPIFDFLNVGDNPSLGGRLSDYPLMSWPALRVLNLYNTSLTGPLLPEIGGGRLEQVWLSNNSLTGDVGGPIRAWSAANPLLQNLTLCRNNLRGQIPPEIGKLQNLRLLCMEGLGISGSIPETLAFANMFSLALGNNSLTGTLPNALCGMKNLTTLSLHGNRLSGELCPELGGATGMEQVDVSDNQFSGALPDAWAAWSGPRRIKASNNRLSGGLPRSWGSMLATVEELRLDRNCLRGPVPCSWRNMSSAAASAPSPQSPKVRVQGHLSLCLNPVSAERCGPSGATLYGCLPFDGTQLNSTGLAEHVDVFCPANASASRIPFNTGTGLTGFCGAAAFSMPTAANSSLVCKPLPMPSNCSSELLGAYSQGPTSGVLATPLRNTLSEACEAGSSMGAYVVACSSGDASSSAVAFNMTIINAQFINRIRFYAACEPPATTSPGCQAWRPLPAGYKRVRGRNGSPSITWTAALPAGCSCGDAYTSLFIRSSTACRN